MSFLQIPHCQPFPHFARNTSQLVQEIELVWLRNPGRPSPSVFCGTCSMLLNEMNQSSG